MWSTRSFPMDEVVLDFLGGSVGGGRFLSEFGSKLVVVGLGSRIFGVYFERILDFRKGLGHTFLSDHRFTKL